MMESGEVPDNAVFVHSSFRTSSTWIWTRFRAAAGTLAYYEYFNEVLGGITAEAIESLHSDIWRSRHPAADPYFREFLPLLRPTGGVGLFDPAMAFGSFFPETGYDGALPIAEAGYVEQLLAHASHAAKTPILTCTRSLGRTRALRRRFGGTHLMLRRRLFHQWNSYSGQARTGNPYFLSTIFETIFASPQVPFLSILGEFVRSRSGYDPGRSTLGLDDDDVFVVFVALHVFLLVSVAPDSDLIIETGRLHEPNYSLWVEGRISQSTGLMVDLRGATERIDMPRQALLDPGRARVEIARLNDVMLDAITADDNQRAMCAEMEDELWIDYRTFALHTEALRAQHESWEAEARARLAASDVALSLAQTAIDTLRTAHDHDSTLTAALQAQLLSADQRLAERDADFIRSCESLATSEASRRAGDDRADEQERTLRHSEAARAAAMTLGGELLGDLSAAKADLEHLRGELAQSHADHAVALEAAREARAEIEDLRLAFETTVEQRRAERTQLLAAQEDALANRETLERLRPRLAEAEAYLRSSDAEKLSRDRIRIRPLTLQIWKLINSMQRK